MTNPVLGRNLGRWAEVYFTTPAEQRERAVYELLLELQKEEGGAADLSAPFEPVADESDRLEVPQPVQSESWNLAEPECTAAYEPQSVASPTSSGVCPVCQYANQPEQWFCGMCGVRLRPGPSLPGTPESSVAFGQQTDAGMPPNFVPEQTPRVRSEEDLRVATVLEPSFATTRREPMWPLIPADETRLNSRWRPLAIALFLFAIAAGIVLYAQRPDLRRPWRAAEPSPQGTQQALPQTTSAPPVPEVATEQPPAQVHAPANPGDAVKPKVSEPSPTPPTSASTAPSPAQTAALTAADPEEAGTEELAKANELLAGKSTPADAAQAAIWLWKAVAKNNVAAVEQLAELYARGEGVPQSCDQAKLLLAAAARRGSADAGKKLQYLQSSQCPE